MKEKRICEYCLSPLGEDEECGCPESVAARERRERARDAACRDMVYIRLQKSEGEEGYRKTVAFSSTAAAINGLAHLIRATAEEMDQSTERVFAVLATVLFPRAQEDDYGEADG